MLVYIKAGEELFITSPAANFHDGKVLKCFLCFIHFFFFCNIQIRKLLQKEDTALAMVC